jgi:hypothetical protein
MRLPFLALALTTVLAARSAQAEAYAPAAYTATTLEYGMFGVFYANFNNWWPSEGPALALNFTPMVLAAGAGFAAHYGDFNARPGFALHGAGWFGVHGFMLGALIDGDKRWGLRAGRWAWTLGAIGAVAGGVIGATAPIDTAGETGMFLGGAPVGFGAGGIFLGGLLVLIGQIDGDNAPGQFVTGALIGTTLGLAVSTYLVYRGFGESSASSSRVQAAVTGPALSDDDAKIFSFGGAW